MTPPNAHLETVDLIQSKAGANLEPHGNCLYSGEFKIRAKKTLDYYGREQYQIMDEASTQLPVSDKL